VITDEYIGLKGKLLIRCLLMADHRAKSVLWAGGGGGYFGVRTGHMPAIKDWGHP